MNEISDKDDVLIGFIDEAAVSINEGSKYGHAFIGVTPLINSPLSNCKVSVLACVLPGFGVLYKYYGSSVIGTDYADFLNDVTNFQRKYVCLSNVQIVFVEDNCKIHRTQEVENTITKLNIGVIPDVPYSPALNGVVEGYFGYVKLRYIDFSQYNEDDSFECEEKIIHDKWETISNTVFTTKISKNLYCEWKARLAQCVKGLPLVSGLIKIDDFLGEAKRLTTIKVFRDHKNINYKQSNN